MASNFRITVTGINATEKFLKDFSKKLELNIQKGFVKYAKKHLLRRIKNRLKDATHAKSSSKDRSGLVGNKSGGYGTTKNVSEYRDWKSSQGNLPLVGELSTRELVATGHLVDSIKITKLTKSIGSLYIEVGPEGGIRPKSIPMKSSGGLADTSRSIDNLKLAEYIEDSAYRFWVKEYEDVKRDMLPLVTKIVRETIKQLIKNYKV